MIRVPTPHGEQRLVLDETHLAAHLDAFALPRDALLVHVAALLHDAGAEPTGREVELDRIVGTSALIELRPEHRPYWGYRVGRSTPSHLLRAHPEPTRWLTAWGHRDQSGVIHVATAYPGRIAPREIHDPDLPLDAIDASIAFWTAHALAVPPQG